MILMQRMTVVGYKSPRILRHLSLTVIPLLPGRECKSSPSRWTGVATSCDSAGMVSCVIMALVCGFGARPSGIAAVRAGAMVKEPKIVSASLNKKAPIAGLGTPALTGLAFALTQSSPALLARGSAMAGVPNMLANLMSFQMPRGTLTVMVDAKLMLLVAAADAPNSWAMVLEPFDTAYVAA